VLRVLLPLAVGHVAAVAMVAAAVPAVLRLRSWLDGPLLLLAAVLLLLPGLHRFGRRAKWGWAGQAGVACGSFAMGTVHGAGLMLLPMLGPLCGIEPMEAAPLWAALVAAGVHAVLMLVATAAVVAAAHRGVDAARRWLSPRG
jgi:hypothetical protein